MFTGGFNNEIWDEHKWEAHLNEIEKKSDQLRRFIAPDPTGNTPRWFTLLQENSDEMDAVDAFIEEELQIEEAYFPDEDDEEWDEDLDDEMDDLFLDEFEDEFIFDDDDDDDDLDSGEEWKELSEEFAMTEYGSLESLIIYNEARSLAAYILQWAESVHPKYRSEEYNDFVSNILKIGAKLAAGYSFGFEQDFLGGNIASTKKALYFANSSLHLLKEHLKDAPFLNRDEYNMLHEHLFELRNDIGIYIQDLREEFQNGFG